MNRVLQGMEMLGVPFTPKCHLWRHVVFGSFMCSTDGSHLDWLLMMMMTTMIAVYV